MSLKPQELLKNNVFPELDQALLEVLLNKYKKLRGFSFSLLNISSNITMKSLNIKNI